MMRIVYLHGFASSPQSGKAQFFRQRFAERGFDIEIPQLDEGDFTGLTITRQLQVIDRTVAKHRVVLMGSSLGGYLAALYAARKNEAISKLILMAPAFQFPSRWQARYPPEDIARWKQEGSTPIYHYGAKAVLPLGYQFMEDSLKYENEPNFGQPALIFHGTRDDTVLASVSKAFAARHPNVTLRLLDSGHELTDVLEEMWLETQKFLGFQSP